jgi:hypothetical protein
MGRYSWSGRNMVEECRSISINWLYRHDYLCGFKSGGLQWKNSSSEVTGSIDIQISIDEINLDKNYLRLFYTQTDYFTKEKKEYDYKIQIVTTPCNYGGVRYWFRCPLIVNGKFCGKRVGKIYLPPLGKYFGCRTCHNLSYRSCKEHDKRVDALSKNPELLIAQMGNNSLRKSLLALKAYTKMIK